MAQEVASEAGVGVRRIFDPDGAVPPCAYSSTPLGRIVAVGRNDVPASRSGALRGMATSPATPHRGTIATAASPPDRRDAARSRALHRFEGLPAINASRASRATASINSPRVCSDGRFGAASGSAPCTRLTRAVSRSIRRSSACSRDRRREPQAAQPAARLTSAMRHTTESMPPLQPTMTRGHASELDESLREKSASAPAIPGFQLMSPGPFC